LLKLENPSNAIVLSQHSINNSLITSLNHISGLSAIV
jgi:hypothetical protein